MRERAACHSNGSPADESHEGILDGVQNKAAGAGEVETRTGHLEKG